LGWIRVFGKDTCAPLLEESAAAEERTEDPDVYVF